MLELSEKFEAALEKEFAHQHNLRLREDLLHHIGMMLEPVQGEVLVTLDRKCLDLDPEDLPQNSLQHLVGTLITIRPRDKSLLRLVRQNLMECVEILDRHL